MLDELDELQRWADQLWWFGVLNLLLSIVAFLMLLELWRERRQQKERRRQEQERPLPQGPPPPWRPKRP